MRSADKILMVIAFNSSLRRILEQVFQNIGVAPSVLTDSNDMLGCCET